jgi:hypothetical protein
VRVCKAWYALACPFLYEYIVLGRNRVLAPLCDALSRAALENRQVGWWTERLDVQMRDATETPDTVFATLADILTYLPNLCILTFSITGHGFASSLPNIVLNSVPSSGSLKCVHWYNCISMPLAPHWTAFLQRHPEIESLDGKVATTPNAHIKLDAVKIVHGYPIRTRRWKAVWSTVDLPAVRSMFYDLTYGIETDDAVTFSRLGQNLTDIQLGFFEYDHMELGVPRFRIALDRICAECARLTRVVFAVHSWCMLGLYTTLPSTVHTLGIRVMNGQISEANIKKLFNDFLSFFIACNPAIKTIKFMEARNSRALRSHPVLLWHGLRDMEKLGVAIKDLDDRLILPPSCPSVVHLQQQFDDKLLPTSTLEALTPTS